MTDQTPMTTLEEIAREIASRVHFGYSDTTNAALQEGIERDVLQALKRAVEMKNEARWLPIETAPKDGTDVLLYAPPHEHEGVAYPASVTEGHWSQDDECRTHIGDCGGVCRCPEYEYCDPFWLTWDGGESSVNPFTHWMPQPNGPKVSP